MLLRAVGLVAILIAAAGCGIGYNRLLFVSSSNVGINVDTAPPVLEIDIARRENVIGPTFEAGVKPPVLASFRSSVTGILGLMANVSGTFAGGDAAETMARLFDDPNSDVTFDSTRCVSTMPAPALKDFQFDMPGPGTVKPFVFGTDTSFGLKVRWSGATAQYPDSVKLGYNRKEWALAAIFARPASAVSGRVASVDTTTTPNAIVFDDQRIYVLTGRSTIVRDGQPVAVSALKPGDLVAIYATFLGLKQGTTYVRAPQPPGLTVSPCGWGEYEVHMPSFLATIDHSTNVGAPSMTGDQHTQLFATGEAATQLVRRQAVRAAMITRLDPKTADAMKALRSAAVRQLEAVTIVQAVFDAARGTPAAARIVAKAQDLGLVNPTTTEASFPTDLADAVDATDGDTTTRLAELERFAKNPT